VRSDLKLRIVLKMRCIQKMRYVEKHALRAICVIRSHRRLFHQNAGRTSIQTGMALAG
jgi:hypothetical protein